MERRFVVYKHTNCTNGKVYIGITYDIRKRWRAKGIAYKSNVHFWQAITKYGWDGFKHEILCFGLTKEEACEKERQLIEEYQACDREKGYNHSPGGENPLVAYCGKEHPLYGKQPSVATRAKMSASHSGERHRCWGKHLPKVTRKRIGDANRGRKLPEWQKELLRQKNTGKTASLETRAKMSEKRMGHQVSEETRQKIRETKKSKPVLQLTKEGDLVCCWPSVAAASKGTSLDRSQIRKCCKGGLKTSGGFIWKFQ